MTETVPTGTAPIARPSALADHDLPALFRSADLASRRGQTRHLRVVRFRLVSLLAAAAFGAVALGVGGLQAVSAASLIAFGTALGCTLYGISLRPERDWYEGRAAAESAKTLAWRYAVGGEPFQQALEDRVADKRLLAALKDVLHDLDVTLPADPHAGDQITSAMRDLRAQPLPVRMLVYSEERIEDQRLWYASKAAWNERRAALWTLGNIALDVAGIVGAALTLFGVLLLDVRGLIATAGTSATAWLQARQHGTLSTAYSVAAQELASVRSELGSHGQEDGWARFVGEAEEAISREHTLWRSSRGVKVQIAETRHSEPRV